jgi:hypothetical protein
MVKTEPACCTAGARNVLIQRRKKTPNAVAEGRVPAPMHVRGGSGVPIGHREPLLC